MFNPEDGWDNTKCDPDSLTSPVKMLWLEMFTAEHGIVTGSKNQLWETLRNKKKGKRSYHLGDGIYQNQIYI